ncbi:MAG: serine/threonine-protein phosphatase [Bacilli bacterium]|nr:serine/threonine-protein phosphatase [Bacilli bacterium]
MSKSRTIDYAILKTLQVHPDFLSDINQIVYSNCSKVEFKNFTSQFGARKGLEGCTSDDFIVYVAENLINLYSTGIEYYNELPQENRDQLFYQTFGEYYWRAKEIIEQFSGENQNIILFFKTNPSVLLEACSLVTRARYMQENNKIFFGNNLRTYLDLTSYSNQLIKETTTDKLKQKAYTDRMLLEGQPNSIQQYAASLVDKVGVDAARQQGVQQVNVRMSTVNKCVNDIVNGSQLVQADNDYTLDGTLYATQRMGKRSNQEDAVLIMVHPANPDFKLMVVSDGMGGIENGEYASSETVKRISQWFSSLDPVYYNFPNELHKLFNAEIARISREIYQEKNRGLENLVSGATFVGAIITGEQTLISSVGDSRAYALMGNRLELLTSDESFAWMKYKVTGRRPTPQEIDDDRFLFNNNVITHNIGDYDIEPIQSIIITNNAYDRLLLFSDGVTDLLTQERLAVLSRGHDLSTITRYIVEEALSQNAVRANGPDEYHREIVRAGKDNATAAMYARR